MQRWVVVYDDRFVSIDLYLPHSACGSALCYSVAWYVTYQWLVRHRWANMHCVNFPEP